MPNENDAAPRRPKCPFYGHSASPTLKILTPSGGNQCALITRVHAPCRMEVHQHTEPDLEFCELKGSAQAVEFATFDLPF